MSRHLGRGTRRRQFGRVLFQSSVRIFGTIELVGP
jgi:hypothetical protein